MRWRDIGTDRLRLDFINKYGQLICLHLSWKLILSICIGFCHGFEFYLFDVSLRDTAHHNASLFCLH